MSVRYAWITSEVVTLAADALKKAAEQFTQVALEMQQNGLEQALFPWNQRQDDCIELVLTLAGQCQVMLPSQILARQQQRPSRLEIVQERSRRDVAARNKRQAAAGGPPKLRRKRGRPRKNPE